MRPDGRFAPSPTGVLHVGNLRTALLAWLFARAQDARFLMRIEDLDRGRVRAEFEHQQLGDLRAIGIDWDGEVVRQSERGELYAAALDQLSERGLLYRCWCTRAEIRDAASAAHGPLPDSAYPGTCRDLTAEQVAEREASRRPPAWRVRAGGARVAFTDRLCGENAGEVDDFVVRRNDGAYAYNLAVVVDDAAQGVGEVVRGADLLDSTPRQLWLGEQLELPAPVHAHVPLMLGPDGARLAKRHGAVTLADREALGESPADVRRTLLAPFGLGEYVTMEALVTHFDPGAHPMTLFVRWILPALICLGGLIAIVLDPSNAEGGAMIIGAGLAVWLLNLLYRVGVTGDRERHAEDRAREYFDRHGHWPDER